MKLLLLFFAAGLALTAALPFSNDAEEASNSIDFDVTHLLALSPEDFEILYGDDDEMKTELGKKLKAHFDDILEKVKEIIDKGNAYKEELAEKLEQIQQKLKDIKMDISDEAKNVIKKLKEKAKGIWKKFLDKLHPSSKTFFSDDDKDDDRLRSQFYEILENMIDCFEHNRPIGWTNFVKFWQYAGELQDNHVSLDDKGKKLVAELKEKSNDLWRRILDWLYPSAAQSPEDFEILYGDDDELKTELGKKLKAHFEEILQKVKEIIDHGKGYKEELAEKLQQIRLKLKDLRIDISDHAKDVINRLKEKAKGFWQKILDKLQPNKIQYTPLEVYALAISPEDFEILYGDNDEVKTELGKKLRAHFDEIMEKLKEIVDSGKGFKEELVEKANQIRQKLKDIGVDISDHAKQLIKKMKEKAKDFWKKILDKLHMD